MSPKSRGRKPKKPHAGGGRSSRLRQVPPDPVAELIRQVGGAVEEAVEGADPLGAEAVAASLLGQMRREAGDTWDLAPLAELIDRCAANGTARALSVVLALGQVLPDAELRARAGDAAERLSVTVERPPWAAALGRSRLVGCWQMTDVFGDQANVLCSFDRGPLLPGTGRHGLTFLLDFNGPGPWVKDLFPVDDVDEALAQLRSAAADSEPITRLVQVSPEDVRSLLLPPLMASVEAGPDDFCDVPSEEVQTLWPLAVARLRDLPETAHAPTPLPAEEVESLVAEFVGSPEAADTELEEASLRRWAGLIARYGNERDGGRPLRVGPGKTLTFTLESDVEDAEVVPLANVLLAWSAWAAERENLPEEAVEELMHGSGMVLDQVFGVPGEWEAEEDEEEDERQGSADGHTDDSHERRRFAMPYREAVIDGERYSDLDPEDPDDLELLVIGEHPEYHEVLRDPTSEEFVDGVNPRLHVALLVVVITRLWTGEPRSTWRTAQKMLAAGAERRQILEALTGPVAEEVHAALSLELGLVGARGAARHTGTSRRRGRGRAPSQDEPTALQVRVDLLGARPPIWRRLVLPATMTLAELHLALQLAFGWTDSHLHVFRHGEHDFGSPGTDDAEDESATRVGDLLTGAGDRLEYEYDFGDSWVHQVVVEDAVVDEEGAVRCLGGRRAGPPEDAGGATAYSDLVQAQGRAVSHGAAEMATDPARFDRVAIDDRLRRVPVS